MISDLKYTHAEGHCIVRYAPPNGDRILTGGADGEVRVFKSMEDEESESYLVGDETLALAVGRKHFYAAGSKMNAALAYDLEDGSKEGVVLRCTADITTLDWAESSEKQLLAGGSDDMTIKVVDLDSKEVFTFKGHEASLLCVRIHPKTLDRMVSTSSDGSIILWSIPEVKILKIHNGVIPKSADFETSKTLSQVCWHPQGDPIFAVVHQHALVFYHGMNGAEMKRFKLEETDNNEEYLSVLDWFSNGKYLVGGTSSGKIIIWGFEDGTVHYSNTPGRSNGIRSIAWSPSKMNEIAFLNKEAYWGTLSVNLEEEEENDRGLLNEDEMMQVFDENDDEDDENSFSIKKIKASTGFQETPDGEDVFDPEGQSTIDIDTKVATILKEDATPSRAQSPPIMEFDLQEAFQPGSTPSHLSSRFMVWNSVGIVKSHSSDEENAIDVEFHDSSIHHAFHLPNTHGYSMASLSSVAVALAAEAEGVEEDEDYVPSRLTVHYFASSDANKEWTINMPSGEEILSLAMGSSWIAAATDKRNLRVFSLAGLQKQLFSLSGPILTLSGHEDLLLIVTHFGAPLPRNQSLYVAVLDVADSKRHLIPHFTPLPLTPESLLSWAGFSDEGTPVVSDSVGVVRLFDSASRQWTEVCNMSSYCKGKSESHFMLGLSEREDILRAIRCKGAKYPVTVPKPTVSVLSLQLPLCDQGSEKSSLEEKFLKGGLLNKAESDTVANNETVLKLFALAIKSDQEARAMEVSKLMDMDTLKIAVKYASKLRKLSLANKLNDLARIVSEQEEEKLLSSACSQNDMFETQEEIEQMSSPPMDNPLLEAKMKRKSHPLKIINETQSQGESRNPFKKASKATSQAGSIRSGLVFDSLSQSSIKSSQEVVEKNSGGNVRKSEKQRLITQSSLVRKENKPENKDTPNKQLKGFLLWLAENPQDSDDSVRNKELGLKIWKEFSKEEKDKYKNPRAAPLTNANINRKRTLDESQEDPGLQDNVKKVKSSGLAAFAAPE